MVTFYKVSPLTWLAGRRLVKAPYLSMVNLVADRLIVPELIQHDMTAATLAGAAASILTEPQRADRMRTDLANVRKLLTHYEDPLRRAAEFIETSVPPRDN